MSTIAAISSPIGAGGIGIVRVSGQDALKIADAIFNFASTKQGDHAKQQQWEPLHMHFGRFVAQDFEDVGYAVYFPKGKSYTGEDTVEFYLHGGVRIMQGALDELLRQGAVLAKNGEFTKRAFLNGRLSLADAEGVIDMINAESAAGLKAAYRLMQGNLTKSINLILDDLEEFVATLEAALDYPDEMEDEVLPQVGERTQNILDKVNALLASAKTGRIAKHGITAVLCGRTNAGKSSLMNALLKEDRAIVTPIAGTTRDTVEDSIEVDGVRINLVDTAGIRQSDDVVESEGIERALRAIRGADVVLHVIDKTQPQEDILEGVEGKIVFEVYNKCDSAGWAIPRMRYAYAISAKTGEGVDRLAHDIAALYKQSGVAGGEIITSKRHESALYQAKKALESVVSATEQPIDCILIDLRAAYDALGEITGRTANEDVVNSIFDRFCVGK